MADDGQRHVPGQRRQERPQRQPGRDRGAAGGQQAQADPVLRIEAAARLDPVHAADHVLQDDRGGHDQAADKAAAGQVVAAQQQVDRHQHRHRQQQPHQHGRNHHRPGRQRRLGVRRRPLAGLVDRRHAVLLALLMRQLDAFGRRTEAAQQRVDRQCHDAEHGDFAQGIEAAEIDQDHVDHVGPAPSGSARSVKKLEIVSPTGRVSTA